MKEITRIHIAKIPYDIEVLAKNEIEKYIKTLEVYANDSELLQDIEIRITELLADHGVVANGVISSDDVASIREQLGEPKDFMNDDDQIGQTIDITENSNRKLYRNTDSAVLGGVLSGIASYFAINSLWLRLIFIATLFFSAGTVLLAYLILWIIIPPAKTAAEKLQMCGKPVTLDSIKELNESDHILVVERKKASSIRRIVMLVIGVILVGLSITTLIFTIFVAFGIGHYSMFNYMIPGAEWAFICAYILAILAGLLLSILFAIGSYVVFTLNLNKRIMIGIIAIVVVGLVSFGTAVGLVSYQSIQMQDQAQDNLKTTAIVLPSGFSEIKKITVNSKSMDVKYVVDNNFRVELKSSSDVEKPKLSIKDNDLTLESKVALNNIWPQLLPTLTIYGPKLDSILVKQGNVIYSTDKQDLIVNISGLNSNVNLQEGIFNQLTVSAKDGSELTASASTVENVIINSQTGSNVNLGTVKNVDITQPEACPIDLDTQVNIKSVSSNVIKYNGNTIESKTHTTDCGSIILNDINY